MSDTYFVEGDPPGEYKQSRTELQLISADGKNYIGHARRTGITRPGYKDRAVYQIHYGLGEEPDNIYYVYDNGRLIPSNEWHENEGNKK